MQTMLSSWLLSSPSLFVFSLFFFLFVANLVMAARHAGDLDARTEVDYQEKKPRKDGDKQQKAPELQSQTLVGGGDQKAMGNTSQKQTENTENASQRQTGEKVVQDQKQSMKSAILDQKQTENNSSLEQKQVENRDILDQLTKDFLLLSNIENQPSSNEPGALWNTSIDQTNKSFQVQVHKRVGSDFFFRIVVDFEATQQEAFDLMADITVRNKWDEVCQDGGILEQISPSTSVQVYGY